MPRLSPGWQRIGAQQQHWLSPACLLIALASCLRSPAPIHPANNVICPWRMRTDAALVHLFHPLSVFFLPGCAAGCFAALPSPPLPSTSFCSAQSHGLCVSPSSSQRAGMSDIAVSACAYPPPSASFLLPLFLLSSFTQEEKEEEIFFPLLFAFFVFCI